MTPTAADANDARDSEQFLPTYVDGDGVGPSGGNSIGDRETTTPTALWTYPPPSQPPAGVPNSISNLPSIMNHAGARLLSVDDNENRRRHKLALVWSYAPDWFVLFCFSSLRPLGVVIGGR